MARFDFNEYNSKLTPQEKAEHARQAGLASAEARKSKKTLSEIVQTWGDAKLTDKEQIEQLKALGIEEPTNKSALIIPLLRNVNDKGDTKSLQMLVELLAEDKRREVEIRKLEKEIERLELEKEKLRKEISGELTEDTITIINNVPAVDNTEKV